MSHPGNGTSAVNITEGWHISGHSPGITGLTPGAPNPVGNRPQVSYTATFEDTAPLAVRVTQSGTSGLTYYNDITINNQSGVDWSTFQVAAVSVNNTTVEGQTPAEHTAHPLFAHFHDNSNPSQIGGWADPSGIGYTTQLGFNSSKGVLTNYTAQQGINGADQLWLYSGSNFAAGTQQTWQDLGIHQWPVNDAGTQGGDFYVVLTPNFWPTHGRIFPTLHTVKEDNSADDSTTGGTIHNDLLYGYEGNDYLHGHEGDDVLVGGEGEDHLYGGTGANWFYGGIGDDNIILTPDTETLDGDVIDGGAGRDQAMYYNATGNLTVTLNGSGDGTVQIAGANTDLIRNVEDIYGGEGHDTITGDALDNNIYGYDGDDTINGGAGFDQLNGGWPEGYSDTVSYRDRTESVQLDLNDDFVWASAVVNGQHEDWVINFDNLEGGSGNDTLGGNSIRNTLSGFAGEDVLYGDLGNDDLNGGTGADRFEYRRVEETGLGTAADSLFDFNPSEGDKIDLSAIDADTLKSGEQAFTFLGSKPFSDIRGGELRFESSVLQGDLNGDAVPDFEIVLTGTSASTLTADAFLL